MNIPFPPVYPITDTLLSGLLVSEQVRLMTAGGAAVVQIREKKASSRAFYQAAVEAVSVARAGGARIIINDRVDIAVLVGADGVHLGQSDLSPIHARRLLGERAIIGYSTHTPGQAAEASGMPVDYIAFGPVFPTATKEDPDPAVGLEMLAEVKSIVGELPLVAIGGITENNLGAVLAAGADSAAIIGDVLSNPYEIEAKVRRLLAIASDPAY